MRRAIPHDAVEGLALAEGRCAARFGVALGRRFGHVVECSCVLGRLRRAGRQHLLQKSDVPANWPRRRLALRGACKSLAVQRICEFGSFGTVSASESLRSPGGVSRQLSSQYPTIRREFKLDVAQELRTLVGVLARSYPVGAQAVPSRVLGGGRLPRRGARAGRASCVGAISLLVTHRWSPPAPRARTIVSASSAVVRAELLRSRDICTAYREGFRQSG